MKVISIPTAPAPSGHYSQAIVHDGLVYVSGQLPLGLQDGKPIVGSIEEQTAVALGNVAAILQAAGSSLDRVMRCTVYISDVSLWPQVNAIYARSFGVHKPARTVVPTKDLHYGCAIEIDAIATVEL